MKPGWRAGAEGHARLGASLGIAALLVLVVAVLYAPTARHAFVSYDDGDYILENPHVTGGLSGQNLVWALGAFHSDNWHPLTWLSHQLDVELFGLAPGPHHLVNAALHALNAVLCFAFLRRVTGSLWASALVALLFALHPQRVESVAWAAERKDVLSGSFFFATLLAYASYARAPSPGRYARVALGLALGLMSKPMLVTLPLVLLLLDLWPLGRLWVPTGASPSAASRRRLPGLVLEKVPLLLLSAASAAVTLGAQHAGGAVRSLADLPLLVRFASATQGTLCTLAQALWPADLAVFYPHPALLAGRSFAPLGVRTWLALALLSAVTLVVWRARRRAPMLLVGWAWFGIMLLPVCGLVQVGLQLHADRYAYLPLLGPTIALVFWARAVLPAAALRPAGAAGLVSATLFALLARSQVDTWKDTRSLCEHALRVSPENYVAHHHLGLLLQQAGDLTGAREHYQAANALAPSIAGAHGNLAALHAQLGQWAEARAEFETLARLEPENLQALMGLAALALQDGEPARAIELLGARDPRLPGGSLALLTLAEAHEQRGEWAEALDCYERSFALAPPDAAAAGAAAWILATGPDEALLDGAKALALAQVAAELGDPRALEVLAAAYARLGNFEQAERLQEQAVAGARSSIERFLLVERGALYRARRPYTRPR